jgi:hypothetical protein
MAHTVITEWGADWDTHVKIDAAIGDDPVDGLLMHVAGPCETGTRVVDVWETKAHMTAFFRDRVVPAMESLGFEGGAPESVVAFDAPIVRQ